MGRPTHVWSITFPSRLKLIKKRMNILADQRSCETLGNKDHIYTTIGLAISSLNLTL